MHAHTPATDPHRPDPRAREAGWSLVELIVVLIIVAILMAAVMISFRSSKGAVKADEAISVAAAYDQAFAQFQADHANRNPTSAELAIVEGTFRAGPKNLLGKPYIGTIPDGVKDGRIAVAQYGFFCGGSAPYYQPPMRTVTQTAAIAYCSRTEPEYEIRVYTRVDAGESWTAPNSHVCFLGNTVLQPRCK